MGSDQSLAVEVRPRAGFKAGLGTFVGFCIIITLLWLAFPIALKWLIPDFAARGVAGDLFGGFTALFSALAFAGLIFTLLIQKEELSLQRYEISKLASETEKQSNLLQIQSEFISKQIFEETFFNLAREIETVRDNFVFQGQKGREAFLKAAASATQVPFVRIYPDDTEAQRSPYNGYSTEVVKTTRLIPEHPEQMIGIYENWLDRNRNTNDFGPYFRAIYTLLKFADESEISDKKFYTNIIRSSLSQDELNLILFNSSSNQRGKLSHLIEKYNYLKYFTTWKLFDRKSCDTNPLENNYSEHQFYKNWLASRSPNTEAEPLTATHEV